MLRLQDKIVRAHGGGQRWAGVAEVMARASLGGMEFLSRFQPSPLRGVEVHFQRAAQRLTLSAYPRAGSSGVFTARRIWIENKRGERLAERELGVEDARGPRQRLLWDELDVLHYCGTLLWQALNLPFVLLQPAVAVEEQGAIGVADERWQRLLLRYPPEIPALAAEQLLYCDSTGLIRRIDHQPAAYGGWLGVTQCWERHETFSGLVYATRRALHPRLASGQAWRLTTLSWLELDDVSVIPRASRA